ncbi:MAG TPA: hypothetical protein VIL46_05200 [Gemmataceae bacterium]
MIAAVLAGLAAAVLLDTLRWGRGAELLWAGLLAGMVILLIRAGWLRKGDP